jgi:hypothetical protein
MQEINLPETMLDFDQEPFVGTYQQILSRNIGKNVRIEIINGLNTTASASGVVYNVGLQYINLYSPLSDQFILVDASSIKFVYILPDTK